MESRTTNTQADAPTDAHAQPQERVIGALRAMRAHIRRLLVAERLAQAVTFGLAAALAAALLDWSVRLPAAIRCIELAALVAGGAWWAWTRVIPAWRFRPPLVELALRVERAATGADRGRIASGVDFAQDHASGVGAHGSLGEQVIQRAASALPAQAPVDARPARRAVSTAVVVVLLAVGAAFVWPDTARIAALRFLTPFADIQWPARTMVEAAMDRDVHPRGTALALRARPVRGDAHAMHVVARYRLLREGRGEWRDVTLSLQPDGTFERLVETDGDALEVQFATDDMETLPVRVALLAPPAVDRAQAAIVPPAYAAGSVDLRSVDLGNGTDRRATVSPPVLAGSEITLDLHMRGATAAPTAAAEQDAWVARTIKVQADAGTPIVPAFTADPSDAAHWRFTWRAQGRGVVELTPAGERGILPADRIAFEVPAIEDAPPTIAITEPASDEAVTPDATPLVVAEGRDDLRVARAWMTVAGAKEPMTIEGTPGLAARVESTLQLAKLGVQPGDRVTVVAHAVDAFESGGKPRDPVASSPRTFRIIAPTELAEQVRARLGQLRDAAGRLREEQAGIARAMRDAAERTAKDGAEATQQERTQLAGTEARLSDRVAAFERALAELGGRLDRNKTDGDGLRESITEAQSTATGAARNAQDAAAKVPDAASSKEASERAAAAEQALADLEAALSRDRETAEISRRIDRLGERIDEAKRAVKDAESKAVGKSREQLDEATRGQLDRAAQAQREAANEARSLSDAMERRAREAEAQKQPDPAVAKAMRDAAKEAQDRGLARQLDQAAQQTQQNQLQGAQQSQQAAQEAVEAMRRAMRNQQDARNDELKRRITSVADSLRALLASIERTALPVQALAEADAAGATEQGGTVLQLARNAAGIAQEAAAGGAPLRATASAVARAAEQLDASATALRAAPADLATGRDQLERARQSVQEALAAAQKAQREAERAAENRRRAELRELYAQVLERQRAARAATEGALPAPGKPLDRRAFIEARRLGGEQGVVSGLLQNLGARPDVSGSALFSASHEEMLEASKSAAQDLSTGAPNRRTVLLQKEIESSIAALIQALEDPPEQDDPFAQQPRDAGDQQQQQGGGGGGQQAMKVPPIAELRLLRTLAQQVLDDTRAADALPPTDRDAYLARIAARQRKIMELGERWMRSMQEQGEQPAGAPDAEAPAPKKPGATP